MRLIRKQNSAMVETGLLLTVFIVLVFYLIFFGITFINRLNLQEGVNYAAAGGDQDLDQIETVDNIGAAEIIATGLETTGADFYDNQDVQDVLTEVTYDPIGYYTIENGSVVYVLDEENLSPLGQYVINNQLDEYVDDIAALLSPHIEQTSASLDYQYTYAEINNTQTGNTHTQTDEKSFAMHYSTYEPTDNNTTLYRDDTNSFRTEPRMLIDNTPFAGFLSYNQDTYWQSQY